MGEPRLSKILIGVLALGLFSLGIMGFLSNGASEYNALGYSNSTLEEFTTTSNEINSIAETTKDDLLNASVGTGGSFDIFGGFFAKAWDALKSTWNSISTFSKLANQATANIPLINNIFRNALTTFIISSIMIILVIGVFFHIIRTSNRL